MIYLLLKSINPDKGIGVSNLTDEIEKAILAKFSNNIQDLLYDMSSNYSINIYTGERNEDYGKHIFRGILEGQNFTLDCFV